MSHYLVKMKKDYADEFDVYGLRLFTKEEYDAFTQGVRDAYFTDKEFYFGTNEFLEFDDEEDYFRCLDVVTIPEAEYITLLSLFGKSYGHFIDPRGY